MEDANAVVDDFDPVPEKWRLRKLPNDFSEFDSRFRINDVTYVLQAGGHKEKVNPVRLSTYRAWQRERMSTYGEHGAEAQVRADYEETKRKILAETRGPLGPLGPLGRIAVAAIWVIRNGTVRRLRKAGRP